MTSGDMEHKAVDELCRAIRF